jgi:hypothetical protein
VSANFTCGFDPWTQDLGHMLTLRAALDEVRFGVVLLDQEMRAQFINRAFRKMWRRPTTKPTASRKPRSRIPAYLAAMLAFVLAAGGALHLCRSPTLNVVTPAVADTSK